MNNIAIVLGTRPEIIKMAPVILECQDKNVPYSLVHTGQHYSTNMEGIFFHELQLPEPTYRLNVRPTSTLRQGEHTGRMLTAIEDIFLKHRPDVVLVQGDTNSVLAGALCASKLHIPLGHVEAGLRSYDRMMPEETNRKITDHLSNYLYVPTSQAKNIVIREGINHENVIVTGNTIVDAITLYRGKIKESTFLEKHGLEEKAYFLVTTHRPENVDTKHTLQGIFDGLEIVYNEHKLPIIFPLHPRTKKHISELMPKVPPSIHFVEPLGFFDFLSAQSYAKVVLTDSGGVQEETCILGVPCVTLRENTERPETLEVGSNILAGTNPERIQECVNVMMRRKPQWRNPFGDGTAGKKILEHILSVL